MGGQPDVRVGGRTDGPMNGSAVGRLSRWDNRRMLVRPDVRVDGGAFVRAFRRAERSTLETIRGRPDLRASGPAGVRTCGRLCLRMAETTYGRTNRRICGALALAMAVPLGGRITGSPDHRITGQTLLRTARTREPSTYGS